MKALHKVALIVGLALAVASCGSDSKSSDTTTAATAAANAGPATTAASGDTDEATEASSADDGSATTAAGAVTPPDADITDLSPVQAKALATTLTTAAAFGLEIDSACLSAVLVQMSDADAQLIVDAEIGESPTLSPEGEALSDDAQKCVISTGTLTPATTGTS